MVLYLIYYYLIIIISLVFSFAIGLLFHSSLQRNQSYKLTLFSLFSNVVVGIIIIITLYSIIITSCKTVSWMYILVLGGYGYFLKSEPSVDLSPKISGRGFIKFGFSLFFVSLFLYVIYLSSLMDFKTLMFTDTNCDWQFYSKTSQYLNLGYESTTQFDNIVFGGSFTPYHYFEIWIVAIISSFFSIPPQIATSIVMPSILGGIAYIGIFSFATKLNLNNSILTFSLLFLSSLTLFSSFFSKIGINEFIVLSNISSVPYMFKLYTCLIFFVLSLHYTLQGNFFIALTCLLFIPIATFVSAPSIIPFVWMLAGFYLFRNKRFADNVCFIYFLFIYTILIMCFYLFFWDRFSTNSFYSYQGIWIHLLSIVKPLFLIISISPFLLFVFFFKKDVMIESKIMKSIVLSYSILLFISMVIAVLAAGNFNGFQFYTNVFIPLSTAFIALFVLRLKVRVKIINVIFYLIFALLLTSSMYYSIKRTYRERYQKFNNVFMGKIICTLKPSGSETMHCAFIHSHAFYSTFFTYSISNLYMVGESLDSYNKKFLQVGLSDYVAFNFFQNEFNGEKGKKKLALEFISQGTFYKYVEMEKRKGYFISIDKSQIKFLNQFNIKYIFIQNDAKISRELSEKIELITAESKASGYSFYKIGM